MKNWKEIPLPQQMKDLLKDKRGYAVPFVVERDKDGIPNFRVNDH